MVACSHVTFRSNHSVQSLSEFIVHFTVFDGYVGVIFSLREDHKELA